MRRSHARGLIVTVLCACLVLIESWYANLYCEETTPDRSGKKPGPDKAVQTTSVTKHEITLTIECPRVLYSGAENLVTLTLRNDGEQPVRFQSITKRFPCMSVEVTRLGKPVNTTALGTSCLVRNIAFPSGKEPAQLKKGEEIRIVMNLTRYFDLSIGDPQYQIVAKTWTGYFTGIDDFFVLRTEPLDFEVKVNKDESITVPEIRVPE